MSEEFNRIASALERIADALEKSIYKKYKGFLDGTLFYWYNWYR